MAPSSSGAVRPGEFAMVDIATSSGVGGLPSSSSAAVATPAGSMSARTPRATGTPQLAAIVGREWHSLCGVAHNRRRLDVDLQDVVEPVAGAAERRTPGHLHNLCLREVRLEPREDVVWSAVPVVGDGDCVLHDEFVELVEFWMGMKVEQMCRPGLGNALDGELRCMMGHTIGTFVGERCSEQTQLQVALWQESLIGKLRQHAPHVLEYRRPKHHDAGLVLEVAASAHLLPQRTQVRWEVRLVLDADPRHAPPFAQ